MFDVKTLKTVTEIKKIIRETLERNATVLNNINHGNAELRFDYTIPQSSTLRIVMIGLKGKFSPIGEHKYRYVLIPNSLVKKSLINMGDYETVKEAFHLED